MERSSLHRLMGRPLTSAPCVPSVASLMGVGPNVLLQTDAEAEPRNPVLGLTHTALQEPKYPSALCSAEQHKHASAQLWLQPTHTQKSSSSNY